MKRFWLGLAAFACMCATFVWAQTPSEFKGHEGTIHSVAISSDGSMLATASGDSTVKIWEFNTGKEMRILKGHTGIVNSVAFNKDGSIVASGGADKIIRIWNPSDGKSIKELKGHTDGVLSVVFSPDGSLLASGGADKTVRLWDAKEFKELKNLGAHDNSVFNVAFNAAGTEIVSSGGDGVVKIWDVKAQKEIKAMKVDLPKPAVKEKDKDKDKKDEPKDKIVKDKKGKDMGKVEPKELREAFYGAVFAPDGKELLTVDGHGFLRYWNLADGKEIKKISLSREMNFSMALSKDGKKVATAGYGGSLRVFEIATGNEIYPGGNVKDADKNKDRKYWMTYSVAFSPDGKSVITGHEENKRAGIGYVVKVTSIAK
jgi:WD40 repeat protein